MALIVVLQVTWKQQGLLAVLRGETPDLAALDQVPGISHTDLYATHLPQTRTHADDVAADGEITLQDLVEIKERIAEQEHVDIIDSSRIETALLFVRAGGNVDTGKVRSVDVFELLNGRDPERGGTVTASTLGRARKLAKWSQ